MEEYKQAISAAGYKCQVSYMDYGIEEADETFQNQSRKIAEQFNLPAKCVGADLKNWIEQGEIL